MSQPNSPSGLSDWFNEVFVAWDRFFFTPSLPHTLAVIRVACGLMMAYSHVIWLSLIGDFMGDTAWIDLQTIRELHSQDWTWSWLFYTSSKPVLIGHQLIAISLSLSMAMGLFTRITTPLAFLFTLMVCHRMTGALFGLDQIIIMLSMYLMISNCGSVWSLDSKILKRRNSNGVSSWLLPKCHEAINNTIATRLIQLHLCVIYLFGGVSKLRGEMWWDGSALWYTAVNYEYQSLNITWLGNFPFLIAALTAGTLIWETFYCALVWPKLTRPIMLAMAVFVHGGIALALGMVTFGSIMIVANLAFIQPEWLLGKLGIKSSSD